MSDTAHEIVVSGIWTQDSMVTGVEARCLTCGVTLLEDYENLSIKAVNEAAEEHLRG